jgi:DNA polymerase IV
VSVLSAEQWILHIDMDAFFAAVEQRDNPALRGKPVIIGGGPPPWGAEAKGSRFKENDDTHGSEAAYSGRGVVTTCSYEARHYGVHSGMPIVEAWKLCPDAIYIHGSSGKYSDSSRKVMEIISSFGPDMEPVSVDEAFLDVTHCKFLGTPWAIARGIQKKVNDDTGLTCSVGIGSNRLLAKMASKMKKPAGVFEITNKNARQIFAPMKVGKMHGIGPSTTEELHKLGIHTLGQLAEYPRNVLQKQLGFVSAANLIKLARGEGGRVTRPFGYKTVDKSIGHSRTFSKNLNSKSAIEGELLDLIEKVCKRLRAGGFKSTKITVQLRSPDFINQHRQITLSNATNCESTIFRAARKILHDNWSSGQEIRLLGIAAGQLLVEEDVALQFDMFQSDVEEKEEAVNSVLDELKDFWGRTIISRCNANMRKKYRGDSRSGSRN